MLKLFSVVGTVFVLLTSHCGYAKDISVSGDKYFETGQWDKAVEEYEALISKNSNHPGLYFKLGNAYCKKGDLEKAVEAFHKATLLKPDYAEAYQRLCEVSAQIESPDDELKVCLKELQKNPNDADIHNKLGLIYSRRNLFYEAKREYETAIGLAPKKAEAYFNLGVLYQDVHTHDKAAEMYEKAIAVLPQYDKAHFNLGIAYYKTGRVEECISEYKRVIELNPEYVDAFVNLGIAFFVKGSYSEAIGVLKKALSKSSNGAKIHYYLGNVYNKMDKAEDAVIEYRQAIEANSKLVAPRYNLGVIYLREKKADLAIEEFTKVIILDHDYADAYLNRSKAYELKGDRANAQSDYNSYKHAKSAFARIYKEENITSHYEGSNPEQ